MRAILPYVERSWTALCRIGHLIERGFTLTSAVVGVAAGTVCALASGAVLSLSDARLLRLASEFTEPAAPLPPVEMVRTLLLIVVFGGLIWAASACGKTREWFDTLWGGGRL
jgi:hypothetical protein